LTPVPPRHQSLIARASPPEAATPPPEPEAATRTPQPAVEVASSDGGSEFGQARRRVRWRVLAGRRGSGGAAMSPNGVGGGEVPQWLAGSTARCAWLGWSVDFVYFFMKGYEICIIKWHGVIFTNSTSSKIGGASIEELQKKVEWSRAD